MHLIDSHTHLERFVRDSTLPAILERARESGVGAMITIGTEPEDWELYARLACEHAGVIHHTVGLHPCSVDEKWEGAVDLLRARLARGEGARPVAIGETGLDRFHLPKNDEAAAMELFERQRRSFDAHLALASEHGLPVVVHSRGATQECIQIIDDAGFDWRRVVFHCWVDDALVIREINRRGGRGSFTGIATYRSAGNIREAALAQGLERLMVETDAPYLTPEPHRGKPNEPGFVAHTAAALAKVFAIEPEALAEAATRNTRVFFGI